MVCAVWSFLWLRTSRVEKGHPARESTTSRADNRVLAAGNANPQAFLSYFTHPSHLQKPSPSLIPFPLSQHSCEIRPPTHASFHRSRINNSLSTLVTQISVFKPFDSQTHDNPIPAYPDSASQPLRVVKRRCSQRQGQRPHSTYSSSMHCTTSPSYLRAGTNHSS